jgi:hydroxymethylglutaryl-CoA lyase
MIKITECPRDAMQGIKKIIPTELKAQYINQLLKVGFDTIDFGSFVSHKAIPQMQDTAAVLNKLDLSHTKTKLLAIIANTRGAENACGFEEISYLGFPFSISETFQMRNTNSTIESSLVRLEEIQNLCIKKNKQLLVYISMAFGNPYGDSWHADIASQWCLKINNMGVKHLALADTFGSSNQESIKQLFSTILPELKNSQIAAHLHSSKDKSLEKIKAAFESGCRSFDVAIHGFGGCPMAKDELVGNMPMENMIQFVEDELHENFIDKDKLKQALYMANKLYVIA